jgi:hypothetical protein
VTAEARPLPSKPLVPAALLLQVATLHLDLAENILQGAPKQQYLFLGDTTSVARKQNLRVGVLARKLWVRPQIARIPREGRHDPLGVYGGGGEEWFVSPVPCIEECDSIRLLLYQFPFHRP